MRASLAGVLAAAIALVALAGSQASAGTGVPPTGGPTPNAAHRICPRQIDLVPYRHDRAAHRRLVPGRPDRLVLCRYTGLTQPNPEGLRRSRAVDGRRHVRRLAHRFNQLPPFSSGPIACPADFGETLLARFRYPHARDDYVRVDLAGCRLATNGPRTRLTTGRRGGLLVRALERLSR